MSKTGKLLIVDDEPSIRELLVSLMRESCHDIRTAVNGKEALEIAKTGEADAILSDINMPVMSGLELLARLRDLGIDTPFIFLTGYGDKEKTLQALKLGATDFLEKPFDPENLIEVTSRALELGIAQKEVEEETQNLYRSSGMPLEKRIRLEKIRKTIALMGRSREIYLKKGA